MHGCALASTHTHRHIFLYTDLLFASHFSFFDRTTVLLTTAVVGVDQSKSRFLRRILPLRGHNALTSRLVERQWSSSSLEEMASSEQSGYFIRTNEGLPDDHKNLKDASMILHFVIDVKQTFAAHQLQWQIEVLCRDNCSDYWLL